MCISLFLYPSTRSGGGCVGRVLANPDTSPATDGVRTGMHLREEVRLTGQVLCSSVLHILCQRNPELRAADRVVFIAPKRTLGRVLAAPGMKVFVISEGTPGTWRGEAGRAEDEKPPLSKREGYFEGIPKPNLEFMLEKAFWEFRPRCPCPVSPATSQ